MKADRHITRRSIARAMIFFVAFSQVATNAHAATDIADVPMAVKNKVPPNIIYVLDDSGSMDSEVLMPTNDGALWWHTGNKSFVGLDNADATAAGVINFNRAGEANATWKKYVSLFPNGFGGSGSGIRVYQDSTNDHFAVPPTADFAWVRSSDYNALYYNPTLTYAPWSPSHDGTNPRTYSNADPEHAKSHPLLGTAETNLAANINSNSANQTFRMWPGMTAPAGASYRLNGGGGWTLLAADTEVPAGVFWDVQISYYPATYYLKDGAGTFLGPDGATLARYEIKPGNSFPSGRSYADEMQNFANWFQYARKRHLMLNGSIGQSLDGLNSLRGGMFTINNRVAVTMYDFSAASDASNERRLLHRFYTTQGDGGTPTRDALNFAGGQFRRTNAGAPIQRECQFNAAFVMTDGFANNSPTNLVTPANYDGQTDYATYPYNRQYKTDGATITHPYQDAYSGTLSDIAMRYYTETLRTDLAAGKVPVNVTDTGPDADRNPNLHMNTYALGLGVKGTIFGTGSAAATDPYETAPVWPDPNAATRSPTAVDDLWHATLNGRGTMLSATTPSTTKESIQAIVRSVVEKVGSAAAVAVANANVTKDNASYASSYNSGNWTGDLNAFPIDLSTGLPSTTSLWTAGSAQVQLDSRTAPSRKIATYTGVSGTGQGIQFQPYNASPPTGSTTLSASQQALLDSPSATDGAAVIAYLRGDRSGETSLTYRSRTHVLGDIVNAEPVVVREPSANYSDAGYSTYKSSNPTRTKMVYQGANDGMLHAFNGEAGATGGAEDWAYIPSLVLPTLNNLSRKEGFVHSYYVDATPSASDVDLASTEAGSGGPTWRTILVGGLGKGGRGYYALDVTTPTAADEPAAAAKVLWEFPNSATSSTVKNNIGYSFGKPIIAKTKASGWVVLVTSGYNNGTDSGGDGHGYLFVLNARTGALIRALDTGVGSSSDPSGLAQISGYVEDADVDNTVQYVYGGDLFGNLWRFDLTGSTSSSWGVTKLATLVDDGDDSQPITSAPELAKVKFGAAYKRMVYVGTGQYLGDSDVPGVTGANSHATQTQTMYGLVDDLSGTEITDLRDNLVEQTLSTGSTTRNIVSPLTVDLATKKGWFVDLNLPGERVNTDAALAFGTLVFSTNIPNSDPCLPGGSSWLFSLDFLSGGEVSNYAPAGVSQGEALSSRPVLIKLPDGRVVALVRKSDATTVGREVAQPPGGATTRRISWRELPEG